MAGNYVNFAYKDYISLQIKYDTVSSECRKVKYEYNLLLNSHVALERQYEKSKETEDELKKQNDNLQREIDRLKAVNNIDGTTSSIPTSQTPLNKKKIILNF